MSSLHLSWVELNDAKAAQLALWLRQAGGRGSPQHWMQGRVSREPDLASCELAQVGLRWSTTAE